MAVVRSGSTFWTPVGVITSVILTTSGRVSAHTMRTASSLLLGRGRSCFGTSV